MWHIYVRREDDAKADRILRGWLHPNTPKKEYPWVAVTHYVSDWRATEAGLVSVWSCGLVKDNLLTIVHTTKKTEAKRNPGKRIYLAGKAWGDPKPPQNDTY